MSTYYVSTTGNNSNNGSSGSPFLTTSYALSQASSGDIIEIGAGTFSAEIEINKPITIKGNNFGKAYGDATRGSESVLAGGIVISGGDYSGVIIDGFTLKGDCTSIGSKNSVIDSRPTSSVVSNISIKNNIIDGEDTTGRYCFYGHNIGGDWTFDGNEIKNFTSWYLIDNTGSTANVPYKLDDVVFSNNHVHTVSGSIAVRGKMVDGDTTGQTDSVIISGNTFNNFVDRFGTGGAIWAALEANNAATITVTNNTVDGVPAIYHSGSHSGSAFQFWSKDPFTLTATGNTITNNNYGIFIHSQTTVSWNESTSSYDTVNGSTNLYLPTATIQQNTFTGNTLGAIFVKDSSNIQGSGIIMANKNYWGTTTGPSSITNHIVPPGKFRVQPWYTDVGLSNLATSSSSSGGQFRVKSYSTTDLQFTTWKLEENQSTGHLELKKFNPSTNSYVTKQVFQG